MLTPTDKMRSELVLDRLRKDYQQAVNALIGAGIAEHDARLAALAALDRLRHEVAKKWMSDVDAEEA